MFADFAMFYFYSAKSGEKFKFNVSLEACNKFGFFSGTRVETPKGIATGNYLSLILF